MILCGRHIVIGCCQLLLLYFVVCFRLSSFIRSTPYYTVEGSAVIKMADDEVSLPHFINLVRQQVATEDDDEAIVGGIVNAILAEHEEWKHLALDGPLTGDDFGERAFDALISSQRIRSFSVNHLVEGSQLQHLLERAIPNATSLVDMVFLGNQMSDVEADSVFSILSKSKTLRKFGFFVIEYSDSMWRSFERFVRESSSLKFLSMGWPMGERILAEIGNTVLLEARFTSLCDSIAGSSSLEALVISGSPVKEADLGRATESLTLAIENSTCLTQVGLRRVPNTVYLPLDPIQEALLRTPAVPNFDWTFRHNETDRENPKLTVTRFNPWKRFLFADNITLSLWPRILDKANKWNKETSHSSLDALYFLMREKNDVLLQNVRKRRIRKRKRFQLS